MATELQVQTYLRGGKTLEDLALEYAVKAKINPDLGVVMLNYNQIASPMAEPVAQECRALILELGTWNVVSRSFFKFFNYGEPNAHPVDWATASVQEKVDGSLICLYFYKGAWQIATKGNADASGPVGVHNMTFADLVRQALRDMQTPFEELTTLLDPGLYYSFELTAPENRVIIPHTERRLTWLAAWSAETLDELPLSTLPALPLPRVKLYPLQTVEELLETVAQIEPFAAEGFVVVDGVGRRVKMKSAAYLMIDRVLSSLATMRRKIEAVLSPGFDDLQVHLPGDLRAELRGLQAQIAAFAAEVTATFEALDKSQGRKSFAAGAVKFAYSALLFRMLDGVPLGELLAAANPDHLAQWLGLGAEPETLREDA